MNRAIKFYFLGMTCVTFLFSCQQQKIEQKRKILILGNSITHHGPAESIGWKGNWGMAASEADSDYVHILRRELKDTIIAKNIAYWESDFNYDFASDSDRMLHPDVLILRLGENVNKDSIAHYYQALGKLTKTFPASEVIVTGTFWLMNERDSVQQKFAKDNDYKFVSLRAAWPNPAYQAIGNFDNAGVGVHPNNLGMQFIAQSIMESLD